MKCATNLLIKTNSKFYKTVSFNSNNEKILRFIYKKISKKLKLYQNSEKKNITKTRKLL